MLTEVRGEGGNLLLNVGPKADGPPGDPDRCAAGSRRWVNANHEVIHGSHPFGAWATPRRGIRSAPTGRCSRSSTLDNATERVFPELAGVAAVDGALEWVERDTGCTCGRIPPRPASDPATPSTPGR